MTHTDEPTLKITSGPLRRLTSDERKRYKTSGYKYCTETEHRCEYGDIEIVIPAGFLTDGSSGGPDYGRSWLFHDYLYSTHAYLDGTVCNRADADTLMVTILRYEGMGWYLRAVSILASINPFWLFSKAWRTSGSRGPEYFVEST